MSSKKKNRKNEKNKSVKIDKDLEKKEETSEEVEEENTDNENDEEIEEEETEEESEEDEEESEEEETEEDSEEDEEESEEEETEEETEEESKDDSDKNSEDNSKETSDKNKKEEKSKKKPEKKTNKEEKDEEDEPDYFWVKVLIVTIIIVWAALITGSWAGNYFLKSEFFKKYNSQVVNSNKPKVWKTIVEVDKSGVVSKSAILADNTDDLQIDDYRNTNEPIPGIDDQSLRNLKDIEPLQEPSNDSSAIDIQITSEDTMENANKISEELKTKGYNPIVEPFVENGVNKYRVKISESSEENANKKIEELKALDYKATIIGK